jgi:hypothetical protein
MAGNIVHCPPETKHFLTVETREGGVVRSVLANFDGSPVQSNGVKYAGDDPSHIAVYLDTITGNHMVKLSPALAAEVIKNGGKVFHGCGGVSGTFVKAPDFTLSGRYGEKAKDKPAKQNEPTEYGGPDPNKDKDAGNNKEPDKGSKAN